jgi:Phage minor capsid protein 2
MGMPLPQTPGDQREDHATVVAASVAAIFERIEHALLATLASLARRVAGGSLLPRIAQRQLAQAVHVTYATAQPQIRAALDRAVMDTVSAVRSAVAGDLGSEAAAGMPAPGPLAAAASAEQASATAADSVTEGLDAVLAAAQEAAPAAAGPVNIFTPYRATQDIYREAVQNAVQPGGRAFVTQSLSLSRIQAAQQALDDLAEHGITGFTDSAGRDWDLTSYVEMATRTAVSALWDDLYNGAAIRSGHDLIETYTHSTEGSCLKCIPWLGKVLSLTGASEGYPTLDEARAAGFRHPSCRCAWVVLGSGEMPEVTNAVPLDEAAAVYKASQKQRALERDVRRAGRRYAVATTPAARTQARRELHAARLASETHRRQSGLVMTKVGALRREHPFRAH